MNKIRKISLLLILCMLSAIFPNCTMAEYTDVNLSDTYYNSAKRLEDLGIISGYPDGTFRASQCITRAEFARIIVSAMDVDDNLNVSGISSGFHDVEQGHWALPYITYISSKGIISGYPDGSFGPSKTITYAEALTIIGRILGYTEETIGAYWPNNYIEVANKIGITDGIVFNAYQELDRGYSVMLIDRALFSKINSTNNSKSPILIENLGYTVIEDAVVLSTGVDDESLFDDEIQLSDNTIYSSAMQSQVSSGEILKYAIINKDDEIVCVKRYNEDNGNNDKTKYTVLEDCYIIASQREDSTLSPMEIKTSKGTFTVTDSDILNKVGEVGTLVLDKNNKVMSASTLKITPVMASHNYSSQDTNMEGTSIKFDNLIVYRDGKAASLSDIKKNDVVYYNTRTNIMDVYTKKVTGIYYDALPSKAYVSEVNVAGKNYIIGEDSATRKLDTSAGAFEIGDKVTLLLGKNDEVVFATELSEFNYFDYGVLIESGQKIAESGENKGSSEYYVKLFMPDGDIYEYSTNKEYKDNVGKLVNIKYEKGKAVLTNVGKINGLYGDVNIKENRIGDKLLLKDVKIINRISSENDKNIELEILNFNTLEASEILEKNVLSSVSGNSFGDVGIIYLTGLGTSYSYGVLKSISGGEKEGESTTYKIYNSSGLNTFVTNSGYSAKTGAVRYRVQNGTLNELGGLYKLRSASSIQAVEGSRIKLDNQIYKMSSDVQIIDISNSDYKILSINELSSYNRIANVTIYSEKSTSDAIVRVVTIKIK